MILSNLELHLLQITLHSLWLPGTTVEQSGEIINLDNSGYLVNKQFVSFTSGSHNMGT